MIKGKICAVGVSGINLSLRHSNTCTIAYTHGLLSLFMLRIFAVPGAHIITVSIGQQLGKYELSAMASQNPENNMYSVASFNDLDSLMPQMPEAICDGESFMDM